MYKRVEAQIVLSGIGKKELAKKIGISYNTLNAKLSGKSSFTLDEALKIKEIVDAHDPVEILFSRSA